MKKILISALVLVTVLFVANATMVNARGQEKVTICHATSSETNPYVEITVGSPAADLSPHLDSNGSPLAGHEQDFLLGEGEACDDVPDPTPTPEVTPSATPLITPSPSPEVTPTPTPEVTPSPEPTPEPSPSETPTATPERSDPVATFGPNPTLPPTDTVADSDLADSAPLAMGVLLLAIVIGGAFYMLRGRNSRL